MSRCAQGIIVYWNKANAIEEFFAFTLIPADEYFRAANPGFPLLILKESRHPAGAEMPHVVFKTPYTVEVETSTSEAKLLKVRRLSLYTIFFTFSEIDYFTVDGWSHRSSSIEHLPSRNR